MRRLDTRRDLVELNPLETRAFEFFETRLSDGDSGPMATERTRKKFPGLSYTFLEWLIGHDS